MLPVRVFYHPCHAWFITLNEERLNLNPLTWRHRSFRRILFPSTPPRMGRIDHRRCSYTDAVLWVRVHVSVFLRAETRLALPTAMSVAYAT